jgi:vitamin B12 transporter
LSFASHAGAGLACLVLLVPLLARGEEEPPPVFTVGDVVVRPPRAEASVDVTASATVVDARRFAGESKGVAELVATAPGVAVHEYGGLGQLSTVSIRGSTADGVKVLLDGLPLDTAAGGGVDLSRIPRQWIDRIEVVRGAEGAHYGSGALGGVVNIMTRPAAAGAWSAEVAGGSFRTGSASADLALGGDRWGALAAVAASGTGGRFSYLFDAEPSRPGTPLVALDRVNNEAWSVGGLLKAWAALGGGRADLVVQAAGGGRGLPGSPYALTPRDHQSDARATAVARYAHPIGRDLQLALELRGREDHLDLRLDALGATARAQRDRAAGGGASLTWLSGPSALTAALSAGGERLAVSGEATHQRAELALTLSEELLLLAGRLRVAPALRAERTGPFDGLSSKLGATARVAGPLSARASVGQTYRVPSFTELYLQQGQLGANPDLQPEKGLSADAGLVADGHLGLATLNVFGSLYRDLIVYTPASFQRLRPVNDGKAGAWGVEAELATAPLGPAALVAQVAYTYLRTETLRGAPEVVGKDLPHRARHRLFARVGAGRGPVEGHVEAHYLGGQFNVLRNDVAIPPALTLNLGGAVRLLRRPDVRLDVELKNLLDDRSLQDGLGNPLPGRMVMVTLRASGGKDDHQ